MTTSEKPPLVVKNLSDLMLQVEKEKKFEENKGNKADFVFRGQNSDKSLLPKLGRSPVHSDLKNREQLMFEEFSRLYVGLTDQAPESRWDLLALSQHYGLPTRFLDWTAGALSAAWFAVENEGRDQKGDLSDAVVWVLKTRVEDFISNKEKEKNSPFNNGKTRIYRPTAITRRISVQGGMFTVHQLRANSNDFVPLERNPVYKPRLKKFVIEANSCRNIKSELNGCGVNRSSLFPDLGGLCSHLAWRYFEIS